MIFLEPEIDHYAVKANKDEDFYYNALVFDASIIGNSSDSCRQIFDAIRVHRFLTIPPYLLEILSYIIQTKQYELISPLLKTQKNLVSAIENAVIYIHEHFRENISFEDIQATTEAVPEKNSGCYCSFSNSRQHSVRKA